MNIILKSILILTIISCGTNNLLTSDYYGNPSKVIITIDEIKYRDSNKIEKQKLMKTIEYYNKIGHLIKMKYLT